MATQTATKTATQTATKTAKPRAVKILLHQLSEIQKNPPEFLKAAIEDESVYKWYFLMSGLPHPYTGGEYVFTLTASEEFPHKPPVFEFITKNGLYDVGGRICISIGEFHADDAPGADGSKGWRPALGMVGFAEQVTIGMVCHEDLSSQGGIRILKTTNDEKVLLARRSAAWNRDHIPDIMALFESAPAATQAADTGAAAAEAAIAALTIAPAAAGRGRSKTGAPKPRAPKTPKS
jgi:ubiquitin-conjugating enzyme E2 J2